MPLYEFECSFCGPFEEFIGSVQGTTTHLSCPHCGNDAPRIPSRLGGGVYTTFSDEPTPADILSFGDPTRSPADKKRYDELKARQREGGIRAATEEDRPPAVPPPPPTASDPPFD